MREFVIEWLKADGFAIDIATNGEEAMDRIKVNEYDLIVLDWDMPRLSGVEVLKQFRQSGGVTPVIMLTGMSTMNDKEMVITLEPTTI